MLTQLPVVLCAHSRPVALHRLLASLDQAEIADGTPLIISVDGGAPTNDDVIAVARAAQWPHGSVRIIEHPPLGLVGHFLACGDLTEEYGAIVFLEDDLIMGPAFHRWATSALNFASGDDRIAGVSLAAPFFDGYRHLPLEPVIDGADAFFLQVPWYDGMAWTASMWQRFRNHSADEPTELHASFAELGDDEWFPEVTRYLADTGCYYMLPREAHATNSGAAGAHFISETNYFQVEVALGGRETWSFRAVENSLAVYDHHMELEARVVKRLVPELEAFDFAVDLRAVRDLSTVDAEYLLTTRLARASEREWGSSLHPFIANVAFDVGGSDIRLAHRSDVIGDADSEREAQRVLRQHATRGRQQSLRNDLRNVSGRLGSRARAAIRSLGGRP